MKIEEIGDKSDERQQDDGNDGAKHTDDDGEEGNIHSSPIGGVVSQRRFRGACCGRIDGSVAVRCAHQPATYQQRDLRYPSWFIRSVRSGGNPAFTMMTL